MKKIVFAICAVLTALLLTFPAFADDFTFGEFEFPEKESYPTVMSAENKEAEPEAEPEEVVPVTSVEEEEPWTHQAVDYIKEHLASIITALVSIYAVFPKWGGIAKLIAAFTAVKTYFDDKKNKNSVANILSGNADAISKFMNDVYPMIKEITDGKTTISELIKELRENKEKQEKTEEALDACKNAMNMMCQEIFAVMKCTEGSSNAERSNIMLSWATETAKLNDKVKQIKERNYDGETEGENS